MKKILVIVGPTASGKSDLAVRLARKFNGEVISADSRQVYIGLNIGTGKITKAEMRGVPHHLLDVADPKKQFSVAKYKKLVEKKLEKIGSPIIAGGTGFYIDALAGKVTLPKVPPDKLLRKKLEKLDKRKLFKMLEKKDQARAKTIDKNNKVRLIRALEIVGALGKVPITHNRQPSGNKFTYIGLKPENLDKRIENRVKKMFKAGLLDEIKKLKKIGITNKRLKEFGFEYWKPTEEKLIRDTRRYAKRQMTWFKRNKKIKWFKPNQTKEIEEFVAKFYGSRS